MIQTERQTNPLLLSVSNIAAYCLVILSWSAPTRTILCDGLDHSFKKLVVVDNVEEVEGKKVSLIDRSCYGQSEEYLQHKQTSDRPGTGQRVEPKARHPALRQTST